MPDVLDSPPGQLHPRLVVATVAEDLLLLVAAPRHHVPGQPVAAGLEHVLREVEVVAAGAGLVGSDVVHLHTVRMRC